MTKYIDIRRELDAAKNLDDYEAVDVLWVVLLKLANLMTGNNEHHRMLALVGGIPTTSLSGIVNGPGVEALINLQPPLETVLVGPHERLAAHVTAENVELLRKLRQEKPREAIVPRGEVLKRIRNKRAHGFKSREGPRDREVLGPARSILAVLCEEAMSIAGRDLKEGAGA